tara:strand:+ start:99 stop:401 length:303 start_codon:yes stop_codon:yes gene_type:complete
MDTIAQATNYTPKVNVLFEISGKCEVIVDNAYIFTITETKTVQLDPRWHLGVKVKTTENIHVCITHDKKPIFEYIDGPAYKFVQNLQKHLHKVHKRGDLY